MNVKNVVIVGAGPVGLAAGLELQKRGIEYLILEKGCLVNSVFHYPVGMRFFTHATDLAIGNHPFTSVVRKPTRMEALAYYRDVATAERMNIHLFEEVTEIIGRDETFSVFTKDTIGQSHSYNANKIIIATGYYDQPNLMQIEGESDSRFCSHYYSDPHYFYNRTVAIVGAGNSACETALDLYRSGVNVHLVHRGEKIKDTIKYWVAPDIEGRIRDKQITTHFNTNVKAIRESGLVLEKQGKEEVLPVDFTFLLTGYHPNYTFLKSLGLELNSEGEIKGLNMDTFETEIQGLYIIGSAGFGKNTNKVFIENGREHAAQAATHIEKQL